MHYIDTLELSVRSTTCLKLIAKIETKEAFLALTSEEIRKIPNVCAKAAREIEEVQAEVRAQPEV